MISGADFVFMIGYKGLKVKDLSEFRAILAQQRGTECHILKNRLIKKAAEQLGIKGVAEMDLRGDTALILGRGDPGTVAKAIFAYAKTHESVVAKAGYLDGSVLAGKDIKLISDLPPIDVLRSQLLGLLQSSTVGLVTVLNAKLSELVNVLNAYKNKKDENKQ